MVKIYKDNWEKHDQIVMMNDELVHSYKEIFLQKYNQDIIYMWYEWI